MISDGDARSLASGERSASEPVGRIPPQPWMEAPATRAVMAALAAGGRPARFVGGCVRDAILNRAPVGDVDIATPEPPGRVMDLLRAAGLKAVPTGIRHGTVTAVADGRPFEITTLRADVETDGRHARVAFIDDWLADAARRDFTINTLSCDVEGNVFDPFGGLDDLARGRVRFVGVARERIEEDVLRLLRFFRFNARYGRPPPDPEALDACRAMAPRLATLSAERVRAELFKILLSPEPADAIALMRGTGALGVILPEAAGIGRLRILAWLETRAIRLDSVVPDPVRRLAALVAVDAAGAAALAARLRLSNRERARLMLLAAPGFTPDPAAPAPALRARVQAHGPEAVRDVALLAWAGERDERPHPPHTRGEGWIRLLTETEGWRPADFPLRGDDVAALGIAPGPRTGRLLDAVRRWWIDGDFRAGREECLARLRELATAAEITPPGS